MHLRQSYKKRINRSAPFEAVCRPHLENLEMLNSISLVSGFLISVLYLSAETF
jgi:hypothetical protein